MIIINHRSVSNNVWLLLFLNMVTLIGQQKEKARNKKKSIAEDKNRHLKKQHVRSWSVI